MSGRAHWNREPHGTPAAARRHYRHGEKPCQLCRQAYNAYRTLRRKGKK